MHLVTLFLAIVPALAAPVFDYKHPLYAKSDVLAVYCTIAIGVGIFLFAPLLLIRIHRVLRAMGAGLISGASLFLACVWPAGQIVTFLITFDRNDDEWWNSLRFMMSLPLMPLGSPAFFRRFVDIYDRMWRDPVDGILTLPALAQAGTTVLMLAGLIVVICARPKPASNPFNAPPTNSPPAAPVRSS